MTKNTHFVRRFIENAGTFRIDRGSLGGALHWAHQFTIMEVLILYCAYYGILYLAHLKFGSAKCTSS